MTTRAALVLLVLGITLGLLGRVGAPTAAQDLDCNDFTWWQRLRPGLPRPPDQ